MGVMSFGGGLEQLEAITGVIAEMIRSSKLEDGDQALRRRKTDRVEWFRAEYGIVRPPGATSNIVRLVI
ncbi:MAG: hypothetical protein AB7W28_02435 [Armatimonadota bacterium]